MDKFSITGKTTATSLNVEKILGKKKEAPEMNKPRHQFYPYGIVKEFLTKYVNDTIDIQPYKPFALKTDSSHYVAIMIPNLNNNSNKIEIQYGYNAKEGFWPIYDDDEDTIEAIYSAKRLTLTESLADIEKDKVYYSFNSSWDPEARVCTGSAVDYALEISGLAFDNEEDAKLFGLYYFLIQEEQYNAFEEEEEEDYDEDLDEDEDDDLDEDNEDEDDDFVCDGNCESCIMAGFEH